ncbi:MULTISPECIES: AMIN-like domain-containing (lipo)protein [Gordonia]|jgi:hypothetical protein|uniref:AMIN-like domain-containing protein n=1 Tax=Gordonia alkanivorans CGMCC 6845 TaxID=1423140 RepID=W9D855_9ACTN|nr:MULTISPECIES: hypothetical protein [Gordonia]AZZ82445.1 hypothetical protein C5O27_16435 [Gordonia alkanivorans]ETA05468.1 hypothetical protein V525_18490 [Gordonia alkanivorans CGMCC 6845]MDH3006862.1 hypothetical protein [Gordonia alkanivorans]MDH3011775.1 hypothetical protein [Gordonia alkanivorans]MDH3016516.1 hypothetical protein [Gordonia alkanivorans]
MMRVRAAVVLVAAALVVAGCSAADGERDSDVGVAPTVTETVTSTPPSETGSTASDVPTDGESAGPKTAPAGEGARLTVTDIRTGSHDGFDRVVYELGGSGRPGWRVAYVDEALQDGSGFPVDVAGGAILEVQITGSAYPFDSGVEPYAGPDPIRAQPGGSVVEVRGALVFEGVTQSFIGVSERGAPFTVDVLTNPTRLVIDVQR